ncbi:MAG: tetratricopeptide repeat protein [Gammaproteobacteria bacterium]|nr:tetratricopeptide repeat protein [Gammaproteobacteria bacterium]
MTIDHSTNKTVCLRLGVFLWVLLQGLPAVAGDTAKEMERLLDAGSAQRAYDLAESRAAEEAGDPEFDFLYALAAIEVGHPERAVFALERVLFLHPQNDRVRLELARAQFLLGNYPEARIQFELVLTHRPPTAVREQIKLFLAKIRQQEKALQSRFHAYAQIDAGTDSNVNGATTATAVDTPALGPIRLDPASQELDDNFTEIELGGEGVRPLSKKKVLFGKVSFNTRTNADHDEFDTDTLGLRGGISILGKRSVFRVPLQYEQLKLDGRDFRQYLISGLEWERPIRGANSIAVFGQLGTIQYDEQDFRDVDLTLIGGSWNHRFEQTNRRVRFGVYLGDEAADNDEPFVFKEHNGRDYFGLYGDFQWNMTPRTAFLVGGNLQSIEHDAQHPVFGQVRDDDFFQLSAEWTWQWRPKWTINIELSYYKNDSNLELFSYDRTQLHGGVRFGF